MSDDNLFEPGIEVKPVQPGYQATVKNGDGTATGFWGRTRSEALAKARGHNDE